MGITHQVLNRPDDCYFPVPPAHGLIRLAGREPIFGKQVIPWCRHRRQHTASAGNDEEKKNPREQKSSHIQNTPLTFRVRITGAGSFSVKRGKYMPFKFKKEAEFDLLALGECMIRLSPPGHQRIELTPYFEAYAGGGEYGYESFFWAHNVISEILALFVLIALAYELFVIIPQLGEWAK
jgi:hypothetical protein